MSAAVIELEGVTKEYPVRALRRERLRALAGVSMRIEPGEVFGVVGPNRAGKTTLVKVLLSLCRPTTGQGTRFGRPLADRRTLSRVGYLHEQQGFPRYLNASQLLEYYGALAAVPQAVLRRRIPEVVEHVGLADRSREPLARFSKGMLARLGLAHALLNHPDLLILDEPTEGLDFEGRQLVLEAIREQRRQGRAVLLVSHVVADIESCCDRIAVLVNGTVVFLGPLASLTGASTPGGGRPLEDILQDLYRSRQP